MCIYFVGEILFPAAKREIAEKMFRFFKTLNFFLRSRRKEKKRENERKKERHVSGQEMRFFGGRVIRFKKAETDVLGRSE